MTSLLDAAKQKAPMLLVDLLKYSARENLNELETIALLGSLASLLSRKTLGHYDGFEHEFDQRLIRRMLQEQQQTVPMKMLAPAQSHITS